MSASGSQLSYLDDSRLAPLATIALPAWLWSTDATRIVWANPTGAAVFGAANPAALRSCGFDSSEPGAAQIARIAPSLSSGAKPRLERLRGFGAGIGRTLTCACSHIVLSDQTAGILVVALERAGPHLPLGERVARLLAGCTEPIAAFAGDGVLMAATESARMYLADAGSLAALGAQPLAESALAHGRATGRAAGGPLALDRIGREDATVLIARFDTAIAASETFAGAEPAPPPTKPEGQSSKTPMPNAGNVVPFRSAAEENVPSLSPVERSAFHELSRKLTQRLAEASAAPRRHVAAASLLEPHGPGVDGPLEIRAADEPAHPRMAVVANAEPIGAAELAGAAPISAVTDAGAPQAAQARLDVLARLSHDIRMPLNSIIGFAEFMARETFGPIGNSRYHGYLEDIRASGGQLLSLITDLLELSHIEAGRLDLSFGDVSLNELARECVAAMQPQIKRARVVIRSSLPSALPQAVADAHSVRQILLHLLSRSISASGPGGQLIVSTALNESGEVALRVRDRGVGMSAQDLAAALAPFRQPAAAVPEISGVARLDLALAKALAQANRARFLAKSAPNEGTLVEVAFAARGVPTG
jgi:signal transduction histidine kinase